VPETQVEPFRPQQAAAHDVAACVAAWVAVFSEGQRELSGSSMRAAHRGYELVHWAGPAPAALALSFGTVLSHVLDAPDAALQMPARQWDTAAVRTWESGMTAGGQRLLVGTAVHLSSGKVAAATVTTVPAGGSPTADQHDTAVLPDHRRHGLARWIKADQALRVHESFPQVREVIVTVNQQNLPMIAVNRAVGYDRGVERLLVETGPN
jgi:GNAT superfamily N-acetyltransferase